MNNDAIRQFVRKELRAVTVGVAAAIGISGGLPAAIAGPGSGTVVNGQGSITNPNATTTLINQQSNQLTINWTSFNIASNETVRFVQPSSSSIALNNILSQSPSQIFGQLDANGRVVLINPNGIIFGRTAQLNVGSLIASSMELKSYDPATGHLSFQSLGGHPGLIDNEGSITAHGGSVALLGGTVLNNGLVVADYGTVAMGAGTVATLDFYGGGLLRLQVNGDVKTNPTGAAAAVQNNGSIQANGGQVLLTAAATQDVFASAVNNTGVIRASRIDNVGGVIELAGPDGVVANSGTLDASGKGASSTGGTVKVTGHDVGLFGNSTISASGPAGGGTVLVGGGFHGADASVEDASRTYVGAGTTINADATTSGDGGKVAVWSNDGTRYYGSISARGAGQGAGGMAEVSGEAYLDFDGQADMGASSGRMGTLLLDPAQITIEHGTSGTDTNISVSGSGPFSDTSSGSGSVLTDGTINTQLDTANVTVTTTSTTDGILISGTAGPVVLGPAAANANTLTLNSAADISWDAPWTYTNTGQLTLYAPSSSISTSLSTNTITLGGASPLLMQAGTGIGSGSVAIETIGLTSVAATNATGGIYIDNSGSGNVTVASLTNPVTASPVTGLSAPGGSDIDLTNDAGSISESGALISTTGTLATVSVGGTTLGGQNSVGTFNATNTGSGNVSLTNTQALTISGISQSGGGLVSVGNTGGTTLTGTVSAGTGSVSLADTTGSLALGANNVSGAGVTLRGVGVTQSGLSTVDAGSGDILVNGGGGAVNMAGTLTTTSNSATAATVRNASTVLLPAITTGSGGTTTIGAGDISGTVSQTSLTTLSTGTLAGNTQGTVTLASAALPKVGAFTSTGFTLNDSDPLSITGALAGGAGGVNLTSSGAISETGGRISTTGTLTTNTVGGTGLTGANSVSGFNATNTTAGDVSLTNAGALTITGISQAGGGGVTVSNAGGITVAGTVSAGAGSLVLGDSTGPLALGASNLSGTGVTLQAVGVTQSAASTVDAASGDLLVAGGGGAIDMAGALTTTSSSLTAVTVQNASTVALPAITTGSGGTTTIGAGDITGAVTQSGSTAISTGTLTGDTQGTVSLGNATIPTVAAFTSAGFTLNDNDAVSITGAVAGGAGGVNLTSSGAIQENGGQISTTGALTTNTAGGETLNGSNAVSTFTATDATNGAVNLTNGAALTITGLSQSGGGAVSVTNSAPITLASANSATGGLTLNSTGDVTLGSAAADSLSVSGGALSVTSGGAIVEQGGSSVFASSTQFDLTSASGGDLVLKNAAAMGSMSFTGNGANLDLELTTQQQVTSTLTGSTRPWTSVVITINSGPVTLPAFTVGGLTNGELNRAGGTDSLSVSDANGAIGQSGAVTVTSGTSSFDAGADAVTLNLGNAFAGNVNFNGSAVTLASSGALSSSGTASGNLSESAAGTITEGAAGIRLTGTAGANTATFTATGATHNVDLGGSTANDFNADATTITASGGNVRVADTNATFVPLILPTTLTSLVLIDPNAPIALTAETLTGLGGGANLAGGTTALDVTAGGAITQSGALNVTGASSFKAGANPITLGIASNSFSGNVAFTGSAVTLASSGALSSSGTASGNLSESAGGAISEGTAGIQLGGTAGADTAKFTVTGSGADDVNLGNTANNFNGDQTTIAASGSATVGNVTVADTSHDFVPLVIPATLPSLSLSDANAPIAVPGETLAGLDVNAGGPITEAGTLVVTGTTALTSGGGTGAITLNDPGNVFDGGITLDGGSVILANSAGTTLAGPSTAGNLTLDAGGGVAFGAAGTHVTGALVVQGVSGSGAAGGAVSQAGTLSVGSTTSIDAGTNSITLSNAADTFAGPVTLTGGAVTLANADPTTLAGASSASSLTLEGSGTIAFGGASTDSTTVANNLVVNAGGAVSQAGTLSVGGTTSIDAGTQGISLSNSANALSGAVTVKGGAVTVADVDAIILAGENSAGSLTLDAGGAVAFGAASTDSTTVDNGLTVRGVNGGGAAGGAVSQVGTLSVGGASTIDAGANDITLGLANGFGGDVAFIGHNVTLGGGGGALSSSGAASGNLTETSASLSQGGVLSVAGDTALTTNGGAITLKNAANTFAGPVTVSGGTVELANADATTLAGQEKVNSLTLDAGGALTFGSASTDSMTVSKGLTVRGVNGSGAAGGTVSQVGTLSVGGATSIDAGANDITLSNPADAFLGTINLVGGAVTLANLDPTTLAGNDSADNLTLDAGGAVTFGGASTDTTSVTNSLIVQGVNGSGAAGGAVSQAGMLDVGGTTSIHAGANDITLRQANIFGGAVTFSGGNVALTAAGSLTASGTASGTLTETAMGSSANLNVGTLSAGGEVLLIAGKSVIGTSSQAQVTANLVQVRYGLENPAGQLGSSTDPNEQIGFVAVPASGRVQLIVWSPASGNAFQIQDVRQTTSDLSVKDFPFPEGTLSYTAAFGVTPAEISDSFVAISSSAQGKASIGEGAAEGAANQGTQSVLYIDWSSYNPNVSLFGTLNPAVCLPADQREEGTGSGSGCAAAASASLLKPPAPIQLAMVLTREGWKRMPLFALQ
jgi:filamentous hemagglutinin family protein